MIKELFTIIFLCFTSSATFGQELMIPKNYIIKDSLTGDLDNDSIKELIVVFDTEKASEDFENVPRELIIYKLKKGKWAEWKRSKQAIFGSREGGMMDDPYTGMIVKNGVLEITHYGGSSWKWSHTDKYRFKNDDFYLVGYESSNGRICEYWLNVDFNLSTGKIIVTKEFEDCKRSEQEIYKREDETFYKRNLKITLEKRRLKEIKIVSPKYKHEIYL
ncbi:hypothetical protein [Polluticaenibacter yanchengensis]|uniref:VCBS repeat-containing protein n=1 Tax=Polluticaenibacter yanchengensis TaxID=3014562 RepID=A0ABT4UII3_9BACT|nr:hypothetical protein [Chitinophagaceae bacterium LY-5]